jgi:two-component system cell cycle sensor histidine kinase/response regulator CckA
MVIFTRFSWRKAFWPRMKMDEPEDLLMWRGQLSRLMFAYGTVVFPLSMIYVLPVFIAERRYDLIAIDAAFWLFMTSQLFVFKSPSRMNMFLALGTLYFMAITFLVSLGPFQARPAWIVMCTVFAGILFGVRGAISAALLDVTLLMALYGVMGPESGAWASVYTKPQGYWTIFTFNTSLLALTSGLAVGFLLNRLDRSIRDGRDAADRLLSRSEELAKAHALLQREIEERKTAEDALKQSEAKYRLLAENVTDVIWTADMDLNVTYVSPSVYRTRSYTPEEIASMKLTDQLTPDSVAFATGVLAEELAIETQEDRDLKRSRTIDLEFIRKDGSTYWSEVHLTFIRDPDGKAVGMLGVSRDVSKRKHAEEALGRSEATLSSVFRAAPVGICIMKNRIYQRANAFWCESFGYPEESIIGKDTRMLYESDKEYERVGREIYTDLQKRGLASTGTKLRRIDGVFRDVELTAALLHGDDPASGTVVAIYDTTERNRAEQTLKQSEERFRSLFDGAPVGYHEIDTKGRITRVNRTELEMLGYTSEDMVGHPVWEFTSPEDVSRRAELDKLAGKMAVGLPFERNYVRKDGTVIPVLVQEQVLHERPGEITGIRSTIQDITERKRAEEEKERLQAQLLQAQKMESVGRLAGGVAHDFNNILGIVIGSAELALAETDSDNPIRQNLQDILKASQRSADLVRQLLAFARKQTISPKVLDLNDTVSGMLKMLRRLIGEDIDLAWMPGHDLWKVKMDPSQVDQILANLAVNARDAIAGVGKVTIETDNITSNEAYCREHSGFSHGQYVILAVSDDGVGMGKEILEHLFEPFFTTKELGKGTGLGLATVYGIVKQNNGIIDVCSEPGKGTTFKIYLPRFEIEAGETGANGQSETLQRGTERVLMVEDEAAILKIGKAMLEFLGYEVLAANSPQEAIRLSEEHPGAIHLLLTDVVMPEMNGRELAEQLKRSHPELKCLYVSGYTANAIAHHGVLDEGVNFMHKPFSLKDLAGKVRRTLDKD